MRESIRDSLLMTQFEVAHQLREAAVDCRVCNDTGVTVTTFIEQDMPTKTQCKFHRCDCGISLKPAVEMIVNQKGEWA